MSLAPRSLAVLLLLVAAAVPPVCAQSLPYERPVETAPQGESIGGGYKTPDVQKRLGDVGMEVLPMSPQAMGSMVRKDQAFWVPLIKKLGITVD